MPIVDHLPLMVASGDKRFQGFKVEAIKFSDWPTLTESLKSGSIDGAHMLNSLAVKMVSDGFEAQAVLLSHRGGLALTTNDSINEVNDFKGKKIGVPSRFSPHYMHLHNYLTKNEIDVEKDVKIIDAAPPELVSMLAAGTIDAYIVAEPFPTLAEVKGVGKTFKLWDEIVIEGTNGLDCVVVFNKKMIQNDAEIVQGYVSTLVETGKYIEEKPMEAAKLASPFMLNLEPETIVRSIDEPKNRCTYDNLRLEKNEFQKFYDYMIKIKLIEKEVDMDEFINDTFANKAYEVSN